MLALALVVQTRPRAIALRFALALAFSAIPLVAEFDGHHDARTAVAVVLGPALALVLLGHRVRERMTIDAGGLTLQWSPLSLGPIPLVRREAFVPWGRVRSVRHNARLVFVPTSPYVVFVPRQYVVRLEVDGRTLTWRLGWHTSNTKAAVTLLTSRVSRRVVSPEVRGDVEAWRAAGAA